MYTRWPEERERVLTAATVDPPPRGRASPFGGRAANDRPLPGCRSAQHSSDNSTVQPLPDHQPVGARAHPLSTPTRGDAAPNKRRHGGPAAPCSADQTARRHHAWYCVLAQIVARHGRRRPRALALLLSNWGSTYVLPLDPLAKLLRRCRRCLQATGRRHPIA